MNTRNEKTGYLLVFIAGTFWGLIGIFVKSMAACGASATMTSFLRVFFAFLIMLVLCLVKCKPHDLLIGWKPLLSCALLGVLCHGVYNICYSIAVTTIGVALSAVLLDIAPLFTLLFSVLFFQEKVTFLKGIAVIINIIGCILTVTNGKLEIQSLALFGLLMGVGAGFLYALTAIIGRVAAENTHPFVMSMYSYFFAAIFLCISMGVSRAKFTFNTGILFWGFFYALIPTAIGYIFYYECLKHITESSKVPVIASMEVIVASLIGVVWYREHLGFISFLGIVAVLLSIVLMNQKAENALQTENAAAESL
mgnify:CR=1 FL=1